MIGTGRRARLYNLIFLEKTFSDFFKNNSCNGQGLKVNKEEKKGVNMKKLKQKGTKKEEQNNHHKVEFDLKEYLDLHFNQLALRFNQTDKEIKEIKDELKRVDAKVDLLKDNHLKHIQRYLFYLFTVFFGTLITALIKILFFE